MEKWFPDTQSFQKAKHVLLKLVAKPSDQITEMEQFYYWEGTREHNNAEAVLVGFFTEKLKLTVNCFTAVKKVSILLDVNKDIHLILNTSFIINALKQ